MKATNWIFWAALALLASPTAELLADGPTSPVVDQFLSALSADKSIPSELIEKAKSAVTTARAVEGGEVEAITAGLLEISPEFRTGTEKLTAEDGDGAAKAFEPLTKSENPFLAAEAKYFLARAHLLREDYEAAIPHFADLAGKDASHTVFANEARFLQGTSEAKLLKRKEATETLTKFLEESPDAPERMRVAAWRQLEYLGAFKEGTLSDVADHMEYSRRKLALSDAGNETRQRQTKIIDMLGTLIKQAEEKECNCSGSGKSDGEAQGEGQGEGEGSGKGKGSKQGEKGEGKQSPTPDSVRRMVRGGPQSAWGKVRDKEREQVLGAVTEKFPARYQKLLEQYYESFQGDDE